MIPVPAKTAAPPGETAPARNGKKSCCLRNAWYGFPCPGRLKAARSFQAKYLRAVRFPAHAHPSSEQAGENYVRNYIGRSQFAVDADFAGAISDFRIYADALEADEILDIMCEHRLIRVYGQRIRRCFLRQYSEGKLLFRMCTAMRKPRRKYCGTRRIYPARNGKKFMCESLAEGEILAPAAKRLNVHHHILMEPLALPDSLLRGRVSVIKHRLICVYGQRIRRGFLRQHCEGKLA